MLKQFNKLLLLPRSLKQREAAKYRNYEIAVERLADKEIDVEAVPDGLWEIVKEAYQRGATRREAADLLVAADKAIDDSAERLAHGRDEYGFESRSNEDEWEL